jgi:hypothetical protein
MGVGLETEKGQSSNAYVQAFEKALEELRVLQKRALELKQKLSEIDLEIDRKRIMAKNLAEAVAKEGDASLKREIQVIQRSFGHSSRTGVAFDAVKNLLSELSRAKGALTTSDVLNRLRTQNIGVDPKAVYNALNYMEKIGKLRRISRGQYLVTDGGYAVHSADEIGGLEDRHMSD